MKTSCAAVDVATARAGNLPPDLVTRIGDLDQTRLNPTENKVSGIGRGSGGGQ